EKIWVAIQMPQGDFVFDSEKDSSSFIMKGILDQPFLIYLDQHGNVVKDEDALLGIQATQLVGQPTTLALASLELLKEYRMGKTLDANNTILPDHPIRIGDNWNKTSQQHIDNQFELHNTATYTLESLNEDLAWINLEATVESSIGNENSPGEINMEGSQNGLLEID